MGRGLERRRIFQTTEDKADLLGRLALGLQTTHSQCLAWALLPNHYHLLLRAGTLPLSRLMRQVLSGYATAYNRRHQRVGYVFQNRYTSILCDEETYFLGLVRYIHLNPVKAKLVKTLDELDRYQWTGHAGLMGYHSHAWQAHDEVLRQFGQRVTAARRHYRAFLADGLSLPDPIDYTGGGLIRSYGGWQHIRAQRAHHAMRIGDERILGESDFVEEALKEDELALDTHSQFRQRGWTLERLTQRVCQAFGVDPAHLTQKGRANALSTAKALICHWGITKLGVSSTELAIRLGLSQPAVSQSAKRGQRYEQAHDLTPDPN